MGKYMVTLAMPVYNVSAYVERALLSALNQTFKSLEILIVDDKGLDNSMEIVQKLKENHPRGADLHIINHESNRGVACARNSAIDFALGDYIFFMDSDDTIEPDTIDFLYRKILETDADVVASSCQEIEDGKVGKKYIFPDLFIEGNNAIGLWMLKSHMLYEVPLWNKLYKLSILKENNIKCVPKQKTEDTVFTFRSIPHVRKLVSVSYITYNYYIIGNSLSHQVMSDFYYNEYLEIFNERLKVIKTYNGNVPNIIADYFFQPFFESFIPRLLFSQQPDEKKQKFIDTIANSGNVVSPNSSFIGMDYPFLYWLLSNKKIWLMKQYFRIRRVLKSLRLL